VGPLEVSTGWEQPTARLSALPTSWWLPGGLLWDG